MVLIKVVQLVIYIDWSFNRILHGLEFNLATTFPDRALIIIPFFKFNDLIAHNIQYDSDSEEDDTEDTECEHRAHGSWNRPPSWQSLLLKLRLFELLDLLSDSLFFVR